MESPADTSVFTDAQHDLLRVLGYLQLQYGDAHKAVIIFDALSLSSPFDSGLALAHACSLLRSGQPAAALEGLDRLTPESENTSLAWLLRGQALSKLGRVAEAARAMRMFIRHRRAGQAKG